MKTKQDKNKEGFRGWIYKWMLRNGDEFIDGYTGEVNLTALVESWESNHNNDGETKDSNHPAWEVAVAVKKELEKKFQDRHGQCLKCGWEKRHCSCIF